MADVKIFQSNRCCELTTNDRSKLAEIRKNAQARATSISFDSLGNNIKHLVYYVELSNGNVYVYDNPYAYTDEMLDEMLERCKPVFVGARHRR